MVSWQTYRVDPAALTGRWTRFPRWGVPLVAVAAIPGVAIALLSIALLLASLLALLLLTVPVYLVISRIDRWVRPANTTSTEMRYASPGSKPVDVRVID